MNIKVTGRENIPLKCGTLVVSNHLSVGDPVLIGIFLGRKIHFMAKEEIFQNKIASYILKYLGAFPVHRGSSTRDALRQAENILIEGKALGMFPEGKRSMQNELQQGMYGTALIAFHHPVPIIPVGFTGTENIRGLAWIWHRPKITLTFGTPFYLPEIKQRLSKRLLEQNSNTIMIHIAELLPKNYRGKYAGKED